MPRPSTEAEYLASLVPPSTRGISRRSLLRGAVGAGSLLAVPSLLAACSSGSTSTGGASGAATSGATGTVSLGSNGSDAAPKAALQSVIDSFQKASSGLSVKINTVEHNAYQEQINNYLQGKPGRRLRLVRRLPHAVLRRPGPVGADRRRVGQAATTPTP